ncbi:MAG TPA: hypothetical protein VHY37_12040, partial [Tepidisphaeraceae bacterium]|nr:hypothetical protein [Tepidisphaeraceae bacterium]
MVSSVSSPGKAVVTPAAEARIIYVSSSAGDDANDGLTPATPVQSITRGQQLVRDSSPDWLLLKRGDRWQVGLDDWHKRGRSAEQPMIIGAYGTGPRPVMKSATAYAPAMSLEFVTVIGVQFIADARHRAAAASTSAASTSAAAVAATRWHRAAPPPPPGVVRRADELENAPGLADVAPPRPGHIADDPILIRPPLPPAPRRSAAAGFPPTPPRIESPVAPIAPAHARIFSDAAAIAAIIPSPADALRPVRPQAAKLATSAAPASAPQRIGTVAPLAPLSQRIAQQSQSQPLRIKRIALARDDSSLTVTFTAS